jgi:hypothetical protein
LFERERIVKLFGIGAFGLGTLRPDRFQYRFHFRARDRRRIAE